MTGSEVRSPWHQRGRAAALLVAGAGTVLALVLLGLLLLPGMRAALATEIADGTHGYGIGAESMEAQDAVALVTPARGWQVQPTVSGLGLLVRTPDRGLTVRLEDVSTATPSDEAPRATAVETLASGLELRHTTIDGHLIGTLALGPGQGRRIAIDAQAADGDLERYLPALAGLLESITPR